MDTLRDIFEKQTELQNKIEMKQKDKHFYKDEPFNGYKIFLIASSIIQESAELQKETNFKYWKKEKTLDMAKIKEETIDILHFVIQLCLEIGLDYKTVYEEYLNKLQVNFLRQEKDY